MTRTVVGLDLSLTSTGVAWTANGHYNTTRIRPTSRGHERLNDIRRQVAEMTTNVDLVVVEGPSYGNQGRQRQSGHHERAGLWWLITHDLWRKDIPTAVVSPAARAKYATGKGNANKDAVLAAVIRRYLETDVATNDEADALILAAMGARHLGHLIDDALDDLPATHTIAMDKVLWPDSEELIF